MNYSNFPTGTQTMGYINPGTQQGFATTTAVLPCAEPARVQPRFDSIADHGERNLEGLHKAIQRLEMLADRLGGATPQPVGKGENCSSEKPNSALRLERIAQYTEASLGRLHEIIERLESL